MKVVDNYLAKIVSSENYNMIFKRYKKVGGDLVPSGELLRWGKTEDDDPDFCPAGPEIADIEISSGRCESNCSWCYKDNRPDSPLRNMSLETYKIVLDKLCTGPLGQVALGLTSVGDNPDLLDIMRYTLSKGCFPNFTISGRDTTLTMDLAENLAELCGALAVSVTPWSYESGLDMVELFTSLGVEQTNIHVVVSEETIPFIHRVLYARMNDSRLANMGAVVGLMVKPKGRAAKNVHPPTEEQYEELVHKALKNNIPIGFDSCSCNRFIRAVNKAEFLTDEQKAGMAMNSDPCESLCFSIYVNVEGRVFSCSFAEDTPGWEKGIDLLSCDDFLTDVWNGKKVCDWRDELLGVNRNCPIYKEIW